MKHGPRYVVAVLSLLAFTSARASAAQVVVERQPGKVCYGLGTEGLCVHDEDTPPGISYTLNKGQKPEKWDNIKRAQLGSLSLTREALGSDRFDDVEGFTRAMVVIAKRAGATEFVIVERPAGKVCYKYRVMQMCLHDQDDPPGIAFSLDTTVKPAVWPFASRKQLGGQPLTRESLGVDRFDDPDGFMKAINAAKAATLMNKSSALEGLIQQAQAD